MNSVLKGVRKGGISVQEALRILSGLPSSDIGIANIDCSRMARCGFPEVVYCEGKNDAQINKIAKAMLKSENMLLLTRLSEKSYKALKKSIPGLRYNKMGRIAYYSKRIKKNKKKPIAIVTGGTSDLPVAWEARITLEAMGNSVNLFCDVGVEGIHRLLSICEELNGSHVIIVIAGMEGALASVVSGLIRKPIIAVPTSSGYGANFGGLAPLLTMLNSCAPGIAVVNIDNGFGAAQMAHLINNL